MLLELKVGKVDMYGALGRDFHPQATDEGVYGMVQQMEREYWDCCDSDPNCDCCKGNGSTPVTIFTIITASGRKLEIMDYEVAELKLVDGQ
jgi:hypothetical protein